MWGTHLDSFGLFQTKLDFLPQKHKVRASWPKWFEAKNQILSEMIQKSPNGPEMAPNGQKHVISIILDPLRPVWDICEPAMFSHFWPEKGLFGPPCAHDWGMAMSKTASNQLRICLRIMHVPRIPKVSIFLAEVEFVTAVIAGSSVKFLSAV